ncbi:haloacid dehalogenase [Pantoea rodasii]|uniref:Haloacid dehalogenase n=1 Tax=Pantoea rodasii TaxID=1076549 RepID=A0A2M9W6C4_9GAMM|nr:HAD hydrolase-like protein [Pantoea rodasii]ORM65253.1 hypothetical protein HA45_04715 [Pantoea rodasii]PJZ03054.1 haloacid dehalogenase [Pantoea rodasii]
MQYIRNVIFDLDGTLVDSFPGIEKSILFALKELGYEKPDNQNIKALIGPPMRVIFEKLLAPFDDARIDQAIEIYREHYRRYGVFIARCYEGIDDVLARLIESGIQLFIATSKRQHFADLMLENNGLQHFFHQVYGSTNDGRFDNKDHLVAHLVSENKLAVSECVLIGDRKDDVVAAQHNAITSIGAAWGYASQGELMAAQANSICESPDKLLPLILRR